MQQHQTKAQDLTMTQFIIHLERIRDLTSGVYPSSLAKNFFQTYDITPVQFSNEKSDVIIKKIIERDQNCIVFTQFVDELEYIKKQLKDILPNKTIESISGSTSLDDRAVISNNKNINILIIQINTASVGLNLQHFNVAHFTNIQWNPSNTDQAIGRINRIGQLKNMEVFVYAFKESIDERIAFIAEKKKQMIMSIIDVK